MQQDEPYGVGGCYVLCLLLVRGSRGYCPTSYTLTQLESHAANKANPNEDWPISRLMSIVTSDVPGSRQPPMGLTDRTCDPSFDSQSDPP